MAGDFVLPEHGGYVLVWKADGEWHGAVCADRDVADTIQEALGEGVQLVPLLTRKETETLVRAARATSSTLRELERAQDALGKSREALSEAVKEVRYP